MDMKKSQQDSHSKKEAKPAVAKTTGALNQEFKKMSYSKMLFTGLGNLVLLVICFWIHWSLGALFLVFWLFVLPYLDLRRLRKYEAENPPVLPKSESFDDTPFFEDKPLTEDHPSQNASKNEAAQEEDKGDQWKSWDDWDDWKKPKE